MRTMDVLLVSSLVLGALAVAVAIKLLYDLVTSFRRVAKLLQTFSVSQQQLGQVLSALDREGDLGEWVTSFRDAADPFQKAAQALTQHYQTNDRLMTTAGELVSQWAGQRESVQRAFDKFSDLVESSQAAKLCHLRDIEGRILSRLEEVAKTDMTIAEGLSELQTASQRMQEAHEILAESMQSTVRQVGEVLDLGRQTQTQHLELIRGHETLQKRFDTWLARTEERIVRVEQNLERQEAVGEHQARLVEFLEQAWRKREHLAPTPTLQIVTVVLLGLQALVLGVVAYGLLS